MSWLAELISREIIVIARIWVAKKTDGWKYPYWYWWRGKKNWRAEKKKSQIAKRLQLKKDQENEND